MSRAFLSELSLIGIILDALGGLYLAYDLLGGKRGPLRILTRSVTYSFMFGIFYGAAFGPLFGMVAGVGLGSALGLETAAISSELTIPAVRSFVFAIYRGATLGVAGWLTFGGEFGLWFGILGSFGLMIVYFTGLAPIRIFSTIGKPKFTRDGLTASLYRAGAIGSAAILAGIPLHEGMEMVRFGIEVGLVVGLVSLVVTTVSPFVEWWVDSLPEKKLGALGAGLVILGFLFQAAQYLAVILKLRIS